MADLVFSGLKLAYKAFRAYSDVKSELAEFEEDFEELEMRLHTLEPVMNALEGRLTDDLTMVLTIAKREQEKANAYTEELFAYCRRFKEKGSHFKAMATALVNKAIDSLPDGLREGAQALAPVISKHGPPEKAYAKFAEKLHFVMSSLSAAAAAQGLKGAAVQASGSSSTTTTASRTAAAHLQSESKAEPTLSVAEQSAKLNELVNEMVEEDEEDFKAILLHVDSKCMNAFFVFAVWVEKVPHLMVVGFSQMPASMTLMRAPSTKFLVDLSQNFPQKSCCKTRWQVAMDMCRRQAIAELKVNRFTYNRRHTRTVVNKWTYALMIPLVNYVVACVVCAAPCLFHRLQIRDFKVDNKQYHIMIENKTELSVNGRLLLNTADLGYSGNPCIDTMRGPRRA